MPTRPASRPSSSRARSGSGPGARWRHFQLWRYAVIPWPGCIRWGKPPVAHVDAPSRGTRLRWPRGSGVSDTDERRLRGAVVGGCVAVLSPAWRLSVRHEVVLFEADG